MVDRLCLLLSLFLVEPVKPAGNCPHPGGPRLYVRGEDGQAKAPQTLDLPAAAAGTGTQRAHTQDSHLVTGRHIGGVLKGLLALAGVTSL